MEEVVQKIKLLPWKFIVPVILVVTIALNIWLGCMPVFKGTYTNKRDGTKTSVTFSDNTYHTVANSQDERADYFGFYYVSNNTIWMRNDRSRSDFKRASVFSFYTEATEYTGYSYRKVKVYYTCAGAIVLQVFYALIMLFCVVYLFKLPWGNEKENIKNIIEDNIKQEEE